MSAFEKARDAICTRAAQLASGADAEMLVKLSDAVKNVEYGPQGANTDYRYTSHYGDGKREVPTGFFRT